MPKRGGTRAAAPAPAEEPEDTAPAPEETETEEERPRRRGRRAEAADVPEDKPAASKPRSRSGTRRETAAAQFTDVDETEIEFGSLDDDNEFVSALMYGNEGTIKTTSALRATILPDKGRVLLINAEGGAKRAPLTDFGVDADRVAVWPKPGKRVSFDGLERLFYKLAADFETDKHAWAAVVWDSGTEIVATLLDQVIEQVVAEQEEVVTRSAGRAGNVKLRDRFETDRDDYRKMSNQVRSLVRKYRYLPCHFIITALVRADEKGKKLVYGPAFTPAIQTDILGYVDVVAYHKATRDKNGDPVYYAQTVADGPNDRAKDRYHRLPAELVTPGFDRMVAYIRGELTEGNDPEQDRLPGASRPKAVDTEPEPAKPKRAPARRTKKEEPPPEPEPEPEETPDEPAEEPEPKKPTPAQNAAAKRRVQAEQAEDAAPRARRTRAATKTTRTRPKVGGDGGYNVEPPF